MRKSSLYCRLPPEFYVVINSHEYRMFPNGTSRIVFEKMSFLPTPVSLYMPPSYHFMLCFGKDENERGRMCLCSPLHIHLFLAFLSSTNVMRRRRVKLPNPYRHR